MSGLAGSPNLDSTLADALQDSLNAEAMAPQPEASRAVATAVSQGIDDSSLGLSPSPSPIQQSPFASRAAAQEAAGDLRDAEADTAIAANLRRTLNRLNTVSLPVALVTAKSDALPEPGDIPQQVGHSFTHSLFVSSFHTPTHILDSFISYLIQS